MPVDREALHARLWPLFLDELEAHAARLEDGLDVLAAKQPELPQETVQEMYRAAHSLKGAGLALGATAVANLCHHLEEALEELREGTREADADLLGRLGAGTDVLRDASRRMRAGEVVSETDVAPAITTLVQRADQSAPQPATRLQPTAAEGQLGQEPPVAWDRRTGPDPQLPAPSGPGLRQSAVRVPAARLDSLLVLAEDLITAAYRARHLEEGLVALADRLAEQDRAWRRDSQNVRRRVDEQDVLGLVTRSGADRREAVAEVDRLCRAGARSTGTLRRLGDALAEAARSVRTVPFTEATAGLARVVQAIAQGTGKQARLVVDAEQVEVDRDLVTRLHDVLRHLAHNAVDHGLEPPEARRRAGKPELGTVRIQAALRSDGIEVRVSDDGGGLDVRAVATRAREMGLPMPDSVEAGHQDVVDVLFRPGLSTAASVGMVSGRGVGLDVVRSEVESMGGALAVESEPGRGTTFVLTVPLTLSSMRALLVRVGGELVVVPTAGVTRVLRVDVHRLMRVQSRDTTLVDGAQVAVVRLARALDWPEPEGLPDERPALLVRAPEGSVAAVVDELVEERHVVVRMAPPRLAGLPALLGTALLEDGTVSLVLSPHALVRRALTLPEPPRVEVLVERPVRRVLLVEDTLTTRELHRSILEEAGYTVIPAGDGAEAWQVLQEQAFDLVVSDITMPRMDGLALCRAIRSSTRLAALPVVLVTSLSGDDDRRAGLEAGADAYVSKAHFAREELLETLERLL